MVVPVTVVVAVVEEFDSCIASDNNCSLDILLLLLLHNTVVAVADGIDLASS